MLRGCSVALILRGLNEDEGGSFSAVGGGVCFLPGFMAGEVLASGKVSSEIVLV